MRREGIFSNDQIVGSSKKHFVLLFVMLFATWLVFSGHYQAKYVIMGFGTALVSAWLCLPILYVKGRYTDKYYFVFGVNLIQYAWYWIWLLNEVRAASMDVATAVMRPEMDIEPRFFSFRMAYDNPLAHATLANSITLTPGTITLYVSDDDVYSIHALTSGAREGLLDGGMQERIAKLFDDHGAYEVLPPAEIVKEVM